MKTTKRLLAVLLALVILCVGVPFAAQAATIVHSGTCGDNLTWTLDSEGTLTIGGTGAMNDYIPESGEHWTSAPWGKYRDSLKTVVMQSGLTGVGNFAFYGCNAVKNIIIPDSVTSIGEVAFGICSSLTSMTIPDSVTSIGNEAFGGCSALTNVTIGNGVTSIPSMMFYICTSLTTVIIGDSVTSIGWAAFYNCSSLTSITIPNSVTSIGEGAFRYCTSLTSVTLGNSVTSIDSAAFFNCSSLTTATIPKTVISIGEGAFFNCNALQSFFVHSDNMNYASDSYGCLYNKDKTTLIQYPAGNTRESFTIPETVTRIGSESFALCSNLTSVTIPYNVIMIEPAAFAACAALNSIFVSENNLNFSSDENGCLYSKDKKELIQYPAGNKRTSFSIPDGVTGIGLGAFYVCDNLTSVIIPDSVISIDSHVFSHCTSLTSVAIPDSVTNIGSCAFDGCNKLKDIYYCGAAESWEALSIESGNEPLTSASLHFHNPQIGQYVPATCTEEGYAPFYCAYCGKLTSVSDPEPPLGHDMQPTYVWAKDDSTVTATMVCTRCDKTGMTETTEVKTEVTVKPTCSTEGELTLIAAFNNKSFYGQTKTKTLPRDPDAHVFKVTVTPPTCIDDGYTTHACTLCRYGYSDTIVPANGHTPVTDEAVPATCRQPGLTEGSHCSVCGEVLTAQEETPALDHADADNDGLCDTCEQQMQGGDHCKYCGKVHDGAFGWLIRFFHSILAIFKR